MKIRWIHNPEQIEDIVISYREENDTVSNIKSIVESKEILLRRDNKEHIVDLSMILFFESENGKIYAHTKDLSYLCDYKLYQLDDKLPRNFLRVSKSCVVNADQISALDKVFNSGWQISFYNSFKTNYVSRQYYPLLKNALHERSSL